MHIVQITPGTGDFHCGCSIRDVALLRELKRRGHEVTCLPLYLPLVTEDGAFSDAPIFYSGISVYLEQKLPFMRRMPATLERWLSNPALLAKLASRADMTSASEHGDMTISMLRGEQGHQARELERLIDWIRTNTSPDVIVLSLSLLAGLARRLRHELKVPVICSLQGEDDFLDSLPVDVSQAAWDLLRERLSDVDALIAPSRFYRDLMQSRTGFPAQRMFAIYNGIDPRGYERRSTLPDPHRIGFLSRICEAKGVALLVDAFIHLRTALGDDSSQLAIAGTMTKQGRKFLSPLLARLESLGLRGDVEILPNVSKQEKQHFLKTLSLLSVPSMFGEAFGLYMAEGMMCGIPLVQPERGVFPELIKASGGGLLCPPGDAKALAARWQDLLRQPELNMELGDRGHDFASRELNVATMADRILDTYETICRRFQPSPIRD